MKERIVVLKGKKVSLVVPSREDIDMWQRGMNNIEINKYLSINFGNVFFREDEEEFYDSLRKNKDNKTFSIYSKKAKKVVGNIALRVDYRNNKGSMGIAIHDEKYHSKGIGTEAIKLILEYGFEIIGLNKIYLILVGFNDRGKKCYEKCGFKEVGRYKEHNYIMGEYHDEIMMEILRKDYKTKK